MKILTAPSLFACDLLNIQSEVKRTENAGADLIHFDIMDGVFVPNISIGFDILKSVRKITDLPIDVHMMTSCPDKYIEKLAFFGADIVTFHNDALNEEQTIKTIEAIHSFGMLAGIALKPCEPFENILTFADLIDIVLVMTVEPGFSGQKFIDMTSKIKEIKEYYKDSGVNIQVDGGISPETVGKCAESGANVFVVGSAAYGALSMKAVLDDIRSIASSKYPC